MVSLAFSYEWTYKHLKSISVMTRGEMSVLCWYFLSKRMLPDLIFSGTNKYSLSLFSLMNISLRHFKLLVCVTVFNRNITIRKSATMVCKRHPLPLGSIQHLLKGYNRLTSGVLNGKVSCICEVITFTPHALQMFNQRSNNCTLD